MPEHDPAALQVLERAASLLYLPVEDGLEDLTAQFRYRSDLVTSVSGEATGRILWKAPLRYRVEFDTSIGDEPKRYARGFLQYVAEVLERPHPLQELRTLPERARITLVADGEVLLTADPGSPAQPRLAPGGAHNVWKRKTEARLRFDGTGLLREAVTTGELWTDPPEPPTGEQRTIFTYEPAGSRHAVRSFDATLSWSPMRFRAEFAYERVEGFVVPSRITFTVGQQTRSDPRVDDVMLSGHEVNTGIGAEGLEELRGDPGTAPEQEPPPLEV